jgi:type IV pilus assembly protein PilW
VLLSPVNTAQPCVVRSLTATPAAPTATVKEVLAFANTGRHNQAIFTTNGAYPENALATLIGTVQWNRYAINGGELQMTRVLDGTTVTLMRNVIGLRAEYGVSATANAGLADGNRASLSSWEDPTDAGWGTVTPANIGRIKAVRIGVVVRSAQREKENKDSGVCEASTVMPQLFGNTITPDVSDWRCYRYRTQIVVAPLRNIIYGL